MEALAAVGLASNVLQFVDLAGKLITTANEIRKRGHPSSLPDLEKLAETLNSQASLVKAQLKTAKTPLLIEDQV
jgi:hypothetical protein